jgi:hypothetical protein
LKNRSDNQQHPETLHVQADEEQVDGENGLHGNGANASLDDYTTGEDSVKYLYVMVSVLRYPQEFERGVEITGFCSVACFSVALGVYFGLVISVLVTSSWSCERRFGRPGMIKIWQAPIEYVAEPHVSIHAYARRSDIRRP